MKLFAVAGSPVLHSKSPQIFASLFMRHSLDAAYCRLKAGSAGELVDMARTLSLDGMNVTAPFKEAVVPLLDISDDAVKIINAANTIIIRKGRLCGYNTDPAGVTGPLAKRKIRLAGKKCLVLGAGGAGRAAVYALCRERADVTIINRTYAKARACAAAIGGRAERMTGLHDCLRKTEILINTIPQAGELIQGDWLPASLVVLDAPYSKTRLAQLAGKRGLIYIPGEEWLLHQALPAFVHFTGISTRPLFPVRAASRPYPIPKKSNIALIGFMGSGKTTAGKLLAESLGFRFEDTDAEIEKSAGCTVGEIFARKGETHFRLMEKVVLRQVLLKKNRVIACGGGAILDRRNRSLLQRHSIVVWLYAPLEVMLCRAQRQSRPLLTGANPLRAADRIYKARKELYFQTADLIVNAQENTDTVVDCIRSEMMQIP